MKKITKVVITGGPCAGKTSAIEFVKIHFEKLGYLVVVISESPTEIMESGITVDRFGKTSFQKAIIWLQIQKEKIILEILNNSSQKNIIVLFDRGLVDHFTYVEQEEKIMLEKFFKVKESELYKNYDVVYHMCSTAQKLPEKFFNTKYRKESIKEAIKADKAIQNAWINHPHYKFISCKSNFSDKVDELIISIEKYIESY